MGKRKQMVEVMHRYTMTLMKGCKLKLLRKFLT